MPSHDAPPPGGYSTNTAGQYAAQYQPQSDPTKVYLGQTAPSLAGHPTQGWRGPTAVTTATVDELLQDLEAVSYKKKKELARTLAMAGFLTGEGSLQEIVDNATLGDITNAYEDVLLLAASRYNGGDGQAISPDDILNMNIEFNLNQIGADENTKNPWGAMTGKQDEILDQSGTTVRKDTSVDIYSAADARGLARGTLQNALGRDPTEAEYEDFVGALQTKQRENPQTTTTRTTYAEDGEVTNSSSTSTGGMGESAVQQFAYEQARENPGYAEWQAIGSYLPLALNALGAGVAGA